MSEAAPDVGGVDNDVAGKDKNQQQQSSGPSFESLQYSEDLVDKLKLLNYEDELCKRKNIPVLSRTYFALPDKNASIQFKTFLDITTWLMKLCQQEFTLDKFDDPTTSVNKLILTLKAMGFELDFPANKLKTAYGDAVCTVLTFLCDKALQATKHKWEQPTYPQEQYPEEAEVDEQADIADISENIAEDEEPEILFTEMGKPNRSEEHEDLLQAFFIEAKIDPVIWKTELERVESRLRKKLQQTYGEEWRGHLEQTQTHGKTLDEHLPGSKAALQLIGEQVGQAVDRITTKEKVINTQFEEMGGQYRKVQDALKASQEKQKTSSEKINQMTNELNDLTEQLEEMKGQMDDRGNSMTDTSPLVKIKTALQALRTEIKEFDIRVGVVNHSLMQTRLKMKISQDLEDSKQKKHTKKKQQDMETEPELDVSDEELF